jgi:hypothetical protein
MELGKNIIDVGIAGAIGYGAARLLTDMNPISGFLAGVTYRLVSYVAEKSKILTPVPGIIAIALKVLLASALTQSISTAFGLSLTFKAALILTGLACAADLAIGVLLMGALALFGLAASVAGFAVSVLCNNGSHRSADFN